MIRYVAAAQALRLASVAPITRWGYRRIGNFLGNRRRDRGLPAHYIQRAHDNLSIIEEAGAIRDGYRVMELGTGWAHWEGLFTRLFYDVEVILFDVWDNRQFGGFLRYVSELRRRLRAEVPRPPAAIDAAEALLDRVLKAQDFDEVYAILNFRYMVVPNGSLDELADASLDLIVSSDVLEHVDAGAVPGLARAMYRVLKPGGYASHRIVPYDHLKIYDRSVHDKNYLQFSDRRWNLMFANGVQYQNRIQHSEWVDYFTSAGFEIPHALARPGQPLGNLKISKRFAHLPESDLAGINSSFLIRRP